MKAFDIAENKSALSFPAEESLSEDYKLPVVQNNYKGEKVGPIEMNMQNLAKSSLKNLENPKSRSSKCHHHDCEHFSVHRDQFLVDSDT